MQVAHKVAFECKKDLCLLCDLMLSCGRAGEGRTAYWQILLEMFRSVYRLEVPPILTQAQKTWKDGLTCSSVKVHVANKAAFACKKD